MEVAMALELEEGVEEGVEVKNNGLLWQRLLRR
jgi:hypothetical protein